MNSWNRMASETTMNWSNEETKKLALFNQNQTSKTQFRIQQQQNQTRISSKLIVVFGHIILLQIQELPGSKGFSFREF